MNKSIAAYAFLIYFVISASLLIWTTSILSTTYSIDTYHEEFEKRGVYSYFNNNTEFVDSKGQEVIDYLRYDIPLDQEFFNDKELTHMQDVNYIIDKVRFLFFFTLFQFILIGGFLLSRKLYATFFLICKWAAYVTITSVLAIVFFALSNFKSAFVAFHTILFSNDLWLLDPKVDMLINLFPIGIFVDFFIKISIETAIIAILLLLGVQFSKLFLIMDNFKGRLSDLKKNQETIMSDSKKIRAPHKKIARKKQL